MTDFTREEVIDIARKLLRADLRNIDLSEAHLRWANLRDADLSGADLSRANLSGADLRKASLIEANLSRASLLGANLEEADLRGANLWGANLSGARLSSAKYNANTQWPEGRPTLWERVCSVGMSNDKETATVYERTPWRTARIWAIPGMVMLLIDRKSVV